MPPRTLASLAHALSAATDLDAALVALAEGIADTDREARVAMLRIDARAGLVRERALAAGGRVQREPLETAIEQLPKAALQTVQAGGILADLAEESPEFARLFALPMADAGGFLSLLGLREEGQLSALLALVEPRNVFTTRAAERFAPMAALFELAFQRFAERDAKAEAVQTLEDVVQRLHGEYVQKLTELEGALDRARRTPGTSDAVAVERESAKVAEEQRRSARRLAALESQLMAAVGQLEQAHVELHRRSEALRQRTRTLYLIERVLTLAASSETPLRLAEALLALVGDDMQALRCSLFLAVPGDPRRLYLAAGRGLAPHIRLGATIVLGQGVAGTVASTREPMLVVDASDAAAQPLLGDEYLTTGSFISFPLVLRDELVGVVNLTNRAQRGLFVEEDVERVGLLGRVISLLASEARLPERLMGAMRGE
ncbi:MAG: GAF domain-containing protein [Gemmatimonadetes bacterium]|nr:GAF domain-containing protein [Gemmatimonadota bacterium]